VLTTESLEPPEHLNSVASRIELVVAVAGISPSPPAWNAATRYLRGFSVRGG